MAAQAPTTMDTMTLLQRQLEVSGSLREKVTTAEQLEEVRQTMSQLVVFFTKINRLATKLQLGLEIVFQCLMQIGMGSTVNFDKQCRQGNVPMHQAKVLDRNASLQAQETEPRLRAAVADQAELDMLVGHCQTLRSLVRMKVEDGNDLSMARKLILLASEYLDYIYKTAGNSITQTYKAFMADDEKQLKAAFGKGGGDDGENNVGGAGEEDSQETFPPVPKGDLSKSVTNLCTPLLQTTKTPFPQRTVALSTLLHWIQTVQDCEFHDEKKFFGLLNVLASPLKTQLGEKRSAIVKTACSILTIICIRSQPAMLTHTKVKEIVHSWLTVLLAQVHVTVSAIATPSDTTVRDIIVSTQGCGLVVNAILAALNKATQAPLRKKCLGFVSLCVVSSPYGTDYSHHTTAVQKFVGNSDTGCRQLSRVLGIILEAKGGWGGQAAIWDAKVEKLAAAERADVLEAVNSEEPVEAVEVKILRYELPCEASAYAEDKGRGSKRRAQSSVVNSQSSATAAPLKEASPVQTENFSPAPAPAQTTKRDGDATEQPLSQPKALSLASNSSANKPQQPLSAKSSVPPVHTGNGFGAENFSAQVANLPAISQLQQQKRLTTPGVPLSLGGFSQKELSGSFGRADSGSQNSIASPNELTASLKARRRNSQGFTQ